MAAVVGMAVIVLAVIAVVLAVAVFVVGPLEAVVPEEPCQVYADPTQLGRLVGNLLANAIRHNPPSTVIVLYLTRIAEMHGCRIQLQQPSPPYAKAFVLTCPVED